MTLIDELRFIRDTAPPRFIRDAVDQAIRALEAAESRPLATWLRIGKHMIAERPDGEVYVLESEVEEMARTMMRLSNERDSLTEQLGLARKDVPKPTSSHQPCAHKRLNCGAGDLTWCKDCGGCTWSFDSPNEASVKAWEDWKARNVLAFGCMRETEGAPVCKVWCGSVRTCVAALASQAVPR